MPNPNTIGHAGELISLGGLKNAKGFGVERVSYTITTLIAIPFGANPQRLWMTIQAKPANPDNIFVYFNQDETSAPCVAELTPGSFLQIDKNLPWWGPVTIYSGVLGCLAFVNECSLTRVSTK